MKNNIKNTTKARCSILGITTLKQRRARCDMIQKDKFHHELEKIKRFRSHVTCRQRINSQNIDRSLLVREIVKNCEERFRFFQQQGTTLLECSSRHAY